MTAASPIRGAIRRRTPLLIAIALALVLAAGTGTIFLALKAAADARLVDHTLRVQSLAQEVLNAVLSAETGQRGYVLTRNAKYLEAFQSGARRAPTSLAALHALVSDNPVQQDRVATLTRLVGEKFNELRKTIALVRAGQSGAALQIVQGGLGQTLMNGIRAQVAGIAATEQGLLARREASTSNSQLALVLLICVSLALAVVVAGYLAQLVMSTNSSLRTRTAELESEIALRQKVEESLRHSQRIASIGELAGGIAHDFNNFLTIIIGNLEAVGRRMREGSAEQVNRTTLERPIAMALEGAQKAVQLTQKLLAFSRQLPLSPTRVDLNRLLSNLEEFLRRALGEQINIEFTSAGGLWPTLVDTSELENAILNLCINARDSMPDGGKLTIETANAYLDEAYARQFADVTPGQYVVVSVSDTGKGIPADILPRVFEPFFTTKEVGRGTGLGLSTVYGFVKQSNGHARVYSELGHGTTVKLYFPRAQGEVPSSAPTPHAPANTALPRATDGETILLVEDDFGVREFAKSALTELGYRVLESADAERALQIVRSAERIDLLFTDVVLTGTTGRELANAAVLVRSELPVLFTTGYSRNAIIHHGRLDPGVRVLMKPFTLHSLAIKIREALHPPV